MLMFDVRKSILLAAKDQGKKFKRFWIVLYETIL